MGEFQTTISEADLIARHNAAVAAQQQAERQQQDQNPPTSQPQER
ncbi:hypothetical protein ACFVHW_07060 [Streptomyces sp. NPDC127110]